MGLLRYLGKDNKYHALPVGNTQTTIFVDNFNEEEQVIGCYFNGKPLYRKCIVTTVMTSEHSANTTLNHNIQDIDKIVGCYGMLDRVDSSVPIPCYEQSGYFVMLKPGPVNITYKNVGFKGPKAYIALEYTKTTDADNSFDVSMLSTLDLPSAATDAEVDYVLSD